ncbi:class I SAM-dependent methyltransferase [Fibrella arboris]|uniref:class I SAM-dependent methyltransferase n=1 Tax=Fibrella arboris TaxID=3242486 RepID=UPI003522D25C
MSILVRLIGFPATLLHGDLLVLDRWRWLTKSLQKIDATRQSRVLDVGCGTGAFTIGAARRGYQTLGLSWDDRNQRVAAERAIMCNAPGASFEVCDVRNLEARGDLSNSFDYIICTENIEHIIDDQKLVKEMSRCLKKGGKLLLTTPNFDFIPMYGESKLITDPPVEDGGHVRIGYTKADLQRLCEIAGLSVQQISFCSGFFSQKLTSLLRFFNQADYRLGWVLILPFRLLPVLFDKLIPYTGYSICLVAEKKT